MAWLENNQAAANHTVLTALVGDIQGFDEVWILVESDIEQIQVLNFNKFASEEAATEKKSRSSDDLLGLESIFDFKAYWSKAMPTEADAAGLDKFETDTLFDWSWNEKLSVIKRKIQNGESFIYQRKQLSYLE
jgi:hypothetical protein